MTDFLNKKVDAFSDDLSLESLPLFRKRVVRKHMIIRGYLSDLNKLPQYDSKNPTLLDQILQELEKYQYEIQTKNLHNVLKQVEVESEVEGQKIKIKKYRLFEFNAFYKVEKAGSSTKNEIIDPKTGDVIKHHIDLTRSELEFFYENCFNLRFAGKKYYAVRNINGLKELHYENIQGLQNRDRFVSELLNVLKTEAGNRGLTKLYIKILNPDGSTIDVTGDKGKIWTDGENRHIEIDLTPKPYNQPKLIINLFKIYSAILLEKSVRISKTTDFRPVGTNQENLIAEFTKLGSRPIMANIKRSRESAPIVKENEAFTKLIVDFFAETHNPRTMYSSSPLHSFIFHTRPYTFFTLYVSTPSILKKFEMLETVDFRELYSNKPSGSDFNEFKDKYLDNDFNLKNKDIIDIKKAVDLFEKMLITYKDEGSGGYQIDSYDVETCNIHPSFTEESLKLNSVHKKLTE